GSPFLRTTATGPSVAIFLAHPFAVLKGYVGLLLFSFAAPEWILRSFIPPALGRWFTATAVAVVGVGLLARHGRARREEAWVNAFVGLCVLGLLALMGGILHYVLFVDYTAVVGGRYLLPLGATNALLGALGTRWWVPLRPGRPLAAAAVAAWALLLLLDAAFLHITYRFYVWGLG
ncbi:MAG: hypothetical protein QHJ73_10870, partial [Armatimonadota bacterium]|nr:hypothetical protein [Armatimonadota bacterium]